MRRRERRETVPDELARFDLAHWEAVTAGTDTRPQHAYGDALRAGAVAEDVARRIEIAAGVEYWRTRRSKSPA